MKFICIALFTMAIFSKQQSTYSNAIFIYVFIIINIWHCLTGRSFQRVFHHPMCLWQLCSLKALQAGKSLTCGGYFLKIKKSKWLWHYMERRILSSLPPPTWQVGNRWSLLMRKAFRFVKYCYNPLYSSFYMLHTTVAETYFTFWIKLHKSTNLVMLRWMIKCIKWAINQKITSYYMLSLLNS